MVANPKIVICYDIVFGRGHICYQRTVGFLYQLEEKTSRDLATGMSEARERM